MRDPLHNLLNTAPPGLIVLDKNRLLRFADSHMAARTGIRLEDAKGQPLDAVYPGISRAALASILRQCDEQPGKTVIGHDADERLEIPAATVDQKPGVLFALLSFSFNEPEGSGCYALFFGDPQQPRSSAFHDGMAGALSELRQTRIDQRLLAAQLEEANHQLLQFDKLASIGQLAAGVAHEINNPVGYVFSNLKTLAAYVRDLIRIVDAAEDIGNQDEISRLKQNLDYAYIRGDVEALISESEEGISRIKRIISSLQDFSRLGTGGFSPADLHEGIDSTLGIAGNEIRHKASVDRQFGELPLVECDISQIKQVILNLVVNAAQAIVVRGKIIVRTGVQDTEVWFEVEDTGTGIDEASAQRLFQPFFTTKPLGQGTGLGLALSHGIIQKHHGRIEAFSRPGEGTRMRVWLPVTQPPIKESSNAG